MTLSMRTKAVLSRARGLWAELQGLRMTILVISLILGILLIYERVN